MNLMFTDVSGWKPCDILTLQDNRKERNMLAIFPALAKINWAKAIPPAIAIAEAARKLYDTKKKHEKTTKAKPEKENALSEAIARIKTMEDGELEKAELISGIADQIGFLGNSLQTVNARIKLVLSISIMAILFCIAILIWIFIS